MGTGNGRGQTKNVHNNHHHLHTHIDIIVLHCRTCQIIECIGITIIIPHVLVIDLFLSHVGLGEFAHVHNVCILLLFGAGVVTLAVQRKSNVGFVVPVLIIEDGCVGVGMCVCVCLGERCIICQKKGWGEDGWKGCVRVTIRIEIRGPMTQ